MPARLTKVNLDSIFEYNMMFKFKFIYLNRSSHMD